MKVTGYFGFQSGKGMVLQLVLPVNGISNNFNVESINSPGTYEEIPGKSSFFYYNSKVSKCNFMFSGMSRLKIHKL